MAKAVISLDPRDAATAVRGEFRMPVDVVKVAHRLGASVNFLPRDHNSMGHVRLGGQPTIWVRRQSDELGGAKRVRFTLAHEIGHIVLYRRLGLIPTKQEYWAHELWCHRFATGLLLPPDLVDDHWHSLGTAWKSFLDLPARLAEIGDVSLDVPLHALVESHRFPFEYLRVRRLQDGHLRVITSVAEGVGRRLGMGAYIKPQVDRIRLLGIPEGSTARISLTAPLGQLDLEDRDLLAKRVRPEEWLVMMRRLRGPEAGEPTQLAFDF